MHSITWYTTLLGVQFLEPLVLQQLTLVFIHTTQTHPLKRERVREMIGGGSQNNKSKSYMEVERFWMRERHWLLHWALSPVVSNARLTGIPWTPTRLSGPTWASPLVKISIVFAMSLAVHLDPIHGRLQLTICRPKPTVCGITCLFPRMLHTLSIFHRVVDRCIVWPLTKGHVVLHSAHKSPQLRRIWCHSQIGWHLWVKHKNTRNTIQ